MEDIQGFLAPGEALVLYGLAEKDDDAHALVLTREEARIVELGKSWTIAAACEALDASDPDADPAAALERLRDLLVKPLALPKETKRLLVSPEGPLSYVPFAALAPDRDVAYEPSGTTYGVLLEEKGKRGEQVLALGDPDYTAKFDPTALDLYAPAAVAVVGPTRGARLSPLPGTRDEAKAVGGREAARQGRVGGGPSRGAGEEEGALARGPLRLPRARRPRAPDALVARADARRRGRRLPDGARGAADGDPVRPRGAVGLRDGQGQDRRAARGSWASRARSCSRARRA